MLNAAVAMPMLVTYALLNLQDLARCAGAFASAEQRDFRVLFLLAEEAIAKALWSTWGNAGKMVGKGMKCWENGGFTLENDGFTLEHVRNCGRTIGKW
jgi:hypothetical protein